MREKSVRVAALFTTILIAAGMLCLASGAVSAASTCKWSWQNPFPQGNDLYAVSAADAAHVWAVGAGGTILFSDGARWTIQTSGTNEDLNDVLALDPSHVWAAGTNGTVLFFDGRAWSAQTSGTFADVNGLAGADARHVWAVGAQGTVLFFDGAMWTAQTSGTGSTLLSVSAANASRVWAAGADGTAVFFNGRSWTPQASGVAGGVITGVSAADPTHVWAVGYRQAGRAISNFILFNDGSSWTDQLSPRGIWLSDVSAADASHVWAVGPGGNMAFSNGLSWFERASGTDDDLNGVSALDGSRAFAVGEAGVQLVYNGAWRTQSVGETFDISALSALDQNHVWAVGSSGDVLFFDGLYWNVIETGLSGPFHDVAALDENHVWAVGDAGWVAFFDGSVWRPQNSGTDMSLYSVTTPDRTHVWAVGEGGAIRFFDGRKWTGQKSGTTQWLTGVSAADRGHVWAVGDGPNALFFNGSKWRSARTGAADGLADVSAAGKSRAWAVGPKGLVALITDGLEFEAQKSWTTFDLNAVSAASDELAWAAGDDGTVASFDGRRWDVQATGCRQDLAAVTSHGEGHAWVGGSGGSILAGLVDIPPSERAWGTGSIGSVAEARTWYLAEGSTGEGFDTWVLVQNPGDATASVEIDYLCADHREAGPRFKLPGRSRASVNAAATVPGEWSVSTVVESSRPVVSERAMYGAGRAWGHASIGTTHAAKVWYLAEGSTGEGFETWVLVQNPGDSPARFSITYMTAQGPVAGPEGIIEPRTRRTFNAADTVPGRWDVSTRVTADAPVVAERAMYGTEKRWGHSSVGASRAAKAWHFAEGSTGPGFETWLLVQNPNPDPAEVSITYMTPDGAVAAVADTVTPGSRKTYDVGAVLPDTWEVSTLVEADRPVVAERAVYGKGRMLAHDSIGATAPSVEWFLAEGSTGEGFETWVLVQNPGEGNATVRVEYMTPDGEIEGPRAVIPARSRVTFNAAHTVPGVFDVSTRVTSDRPVVAERAMYGDGK